MKTVPLAIILKKMSDKKEFIYYEVELPYENKKFFIEIAPSNRLVKYFSDPTFNQLIQETKIPSDPNDKFQEIIGIAPSISNFIAFHIFKSLLTKDFPNMISKISS